MTRMYRAAVLLLSSVRAHDFEGLFQLKSSENNCVTHYGHLEGCDSVLSQWKAIPDDPEKGKLQSKNLRLVDVIA